MVSSCITKILLHIQTTLQNTQWGITAEETNFSEVHQSFTHYVPLFTACTWAADAEDQMQLIGFTLPTWRETVDKNRQSLTLLQWPSQLVTVSLPGIKDSYCIIAKFSWLIPYLRLKGKAQPGHVAIGKVPGVFTAFTQHIQPPVCKLIIFIRGTKVRKQGEEWTENSPGLRPPNSYTNIAAERYNEQSGIPRLCSFQGFFTIAIIYIRGYFRWGLLSCWHFVCNLLFISNQNKNLKRYGKK